MAQGQPAQAMGHAAGLRGLKPGQTGLQFLAGPSPIRIHLVRHGQTQENLEMRFPGTDARLTAQGRAQGRGAGLEFRRKGILPETILVSPSARTFETLEEAVSILQVQPRIIVVPELLEKDPGGARGLKIPASRAEVDLVSVPRGGESFPRFTERIASAFLAILEEIRLGRIPGREIAVFGHSLANKICLGVSQGLSGHEALAKPEIPNGSVRTIRLN